MSHSEIVLTRGKVALVDEEDFERLNAVCWQFNPKGYACRTERSNGLQRNVQMHRVVLDAPKDKEVDHVNGDGLDNRKANLRLCDRCENTRNTKRCRTNESGFKGVSWHKVTGKWVAQICVDRKKTHLGLFANPVDAKIAYDDAAKQYFKDFVRVSETLNQGGSK